MPGTQAELAEVKLNAGAAAQRRPSAGRAAASAALSGLCDRVLSSLGGPGAAAGRARQRLVLKATGGELQDVGPEDCRRIVAEVWEARDSRWVLQRLRERPLHGDHAVAFRGLVVMHRVLQQGPREVVSEWPLPNPVLDGLAEHWGQVARVAQAGSQAHHCAQVVEEYSMVLSAKQRLMCERDAGLGCFDGGLLYDRPAPEPSESLQALALLLGYGERLTPLRRGRLPHGSARSPRRSASGALPRCSTRPGCSSARRPCW
ncbi:unnamed protein product [Prorocentrum cordatum]|uniref:AP180 N-terminal homology (ANTH) domain-containing protein n=1 Tax=Prorocentrum cordatum TaxID=2364126 RepID=A0ABN9Q948_9DINO|nr:unnamed protein product [Polarella glacialis]